MKLQDLLKRRAISVHTVLICKLGGIHTGCRKHQGRWKPSKCVIELKPWNDPSPLCLARKAKGEHLCKKIT
jgi:hypothetical protein